MPNVLLPPSASYSGSPAGVAAGGVLVMLNGPNPRPSVSVVLLRPLLPSCGQKREASGQVRMSEVDGANGKTGHGQMAPPVGLVDSLRWFRLYL